MRSDQLLNILIHKISNHTMVSKLILGPKLMNDIMSHKLLNEIHDLKIKEINQYFLDYKIDVNSSDANGEGFIHKVVIGNTFKGKSIHNDIHTGETIKYLVEKEININLRELTNGHTPLHYATKFNYNFAVTALLEYGAKGGVTDYNANQPIDLFHPSNEEGKRLFHITDDTSQEVNAIGEINNNSSEGVD